VPSSAARAVPLTESDRNLQANLDLGATINPNDCGLIGWTFDPQFGASTLTMTAGTLYLVTIKLARKAPITNVLVPLSGGGAGTTASYVVVYDMNGTQLGVSADQGTSWTAAGTKVVALTSPTITLNAGTLVRVGYLAVGGTPVIRATSSAATVNQGIQRYATPASQTSAPAQLIGQSAATQPSLVFLS
jgi:hypothetical protein